MHWRVNSSRINHPDDPYPDLLPDAQWTWLDCVRIGAACALGVVVVYGGIALVAWEVLR